MEAASAEEVAWEADYFAGDPYYFVRVRIFTVNEFRIVLELLVSRGLKIKGLQDATLRSRSRRNQNFAFASPNLRVLGIVIELHSISVPAMQIARRPCCRECVEL
jgi:hypothetical protein